MGTDAKPGAGQERGMKPGVWQWYIAPEFKAADCWIGVFWKWEHENRFDLWLCLLPMVPIHFTATRFPREIFG